MNASENTTKLITEEVNCDLCHDTKSDVLYEFSDSLYDIPGFFQLRTCRNCGLMYLSPRPTESSIARYYPDDYSSYRPPIEEERSALMRWMRRRKLVKRRDMITRYLGQDNGRLLDVGSATGLFLNEMVQSGWDGHGVELIPSAANFSREYFNLDVFQGYLEDAPYKTNSFDVVTFWDVLEHTFSPTKTLDKASSLLRTGGILAFSIPNWESFDRKRFGPNWHGYDPPRHLFVFSKESLSKYLTNAGFELVDRVCFFPGYFFFIISLERWLKAKHPKHLNRVKRILSIPGFRLILEPWFTAQNWLGIGGIVTVFARKTEPEQTPS